ncbi:MAG: hypothetical protein USCAAHI_01763 [Beijerinckiaceae bacterium]|nr:MAG: hypothetical protein USCAAHI_01763 [Beijerinckiaceae bacterium]
MSVTSPRPPRGRHHGRADDHRRPHRRRIRPPNLPAMWTSATGPLSSRTARHPKGFFRLKEGTGLQHCIARGFAFAEFADLVMGDLASRPQRCARLRRMRPKEVSRQDDGLQLLALAQSRSRHGGVLRTPAAGVRFGSAGLLGNAPSARGRHGLFRRGDRRGLRRRCFDDCVGAPTETAQFKKPAAEVAEYFWRLPGYEDRSPLPGRDFFWGSPKTVRAGGVSRPPSQR